MATIALFVALGGGAYALTRGEVKSKHIARDAVKAKHIDFGVRSTPMMAAVDGLPGGIGSGQFPVTGSHTFAGGFAQSLAPQTFVATGLHVRLLGGPLTAGVRETYFDVNGEDTELACTIAAGEDSCQSDARVRVPRGATVWLRLRHNGAGETDSAQIGWRAVLP